MKTILASVVLTLATYAQAACAEDYHISVFKQSQSFHQSNQHTVQPTWLIGQQGKPQIIGFTQITRTHQLADNTNESVQHTLGVGGKIDITVHAGGSLFKGGEIKRAVQTGQAPIGERFMSAHANEAPLLGWDNLPFIATTYEENNKLWEAAQDKVNAQLDSLNLVALYTCPWPGQGFYFNKAVTSSADTKGVKFRSYNAATATFAKELGMTPVQIEAAELSQT